MAKQSGSTKYTKYSISAIPARLLSQNLAILSPTTANIIRAENKVNGVVKSKILASASVAKPFTAEVSIDPCHGSVPTTAPSKSAFFAKPLENYHHNQ